MRATRATMRAFILFLDFDGVLSPGNTGTLRYAPALAAALREFPALEVVLSTNWREREPLEDLLGWLPAELAGRVIGATPVLTEGDGRGARQREIEAWLRQHPSRTWLAVDDTAELFAPGCPWLFMTDGRQALDSAALVALSCELRRRGASA